MLKVPKEGTDYLDAPATPEPRGFIPRGASAQTKACGAGAAHVGSDAQSPAARFALVIPALNEEEAIGGTLSRALAARAEVVAKTPIDEMLVVFVNDGSTDGTQDIADRYSEVVKIRFAENRGYGAAIKAGFLASDAQLVGFMDADGTCDPLFCIPLINRLHETDADVVLGARLHSESEMPFVRRLGNRIFARLVGVVSGQTLTDSASGMRVIRRESLRRMVPLPDGLHFTPAMSCIASLEPRLRIEEVPMPYKERIGRSKLSVVKDGVKFLGIILFAAACCNPLTSLTCLGLLFCCLGAILCVVMMSLGAEWPMAAALGGGFVLVLVQSAFVGLLCHQLNFLLIGPRVIPGKAARLMDKLFWAKPMVITGLGMFLLAMVLWLAAWASSSPVRSYLWVAAALCVAIAGWSVLGGVALRMIWAARERQRAESSDPFAARTGEEATRSSRHDAPAAVSAQSE